MAYWLSRNGVNVTVVERSPALRKAGGHAVDLFKPAMDIAEKMGVLAQVEREGHRHRGHLVSTARHEIAATVIPILRLMSAVSDRHVEIMRDDLWQILYDACRDHVDFPLR